MICLRRYETIEGNEEVSEVAIRLPCNHVMGLKCISTWLSPDRGMRKNTCPYCRHKLFAVLPDTLDFLGERSEATIQSGNHGSLESMRAAFRATLALSNAVMNEAQEAHDRLEPRSMNEEASVIESNHSLMVASTQVTHQLRILTQELRDLHQTFREYVEETHPPHTGAATQEH